MIELLGTNLFTSSQGFQAMWMVCAAAVFASLPLVRRMRRHQEEEDGEGR